MKEKGSVQDQEQVKGNWWGGGNNYQRDGVRKTNIIEDMWESKSNMLAREGSSNEKLRKNEFRQYKMKK